MSELTEWQCVNGPECQAGCLRCFEAALRAQIAAEIRAEREGFLPSPGLDPVWIAGWHAATDHIAARIAEGGTDECHCPPCSGRGSDGHGMNHCAECCFGSGVEADPDCPKHGRHR